MLYCSHSHRHFIVCCFIRCFTVFLEKSFSTLRQKLNVQVEVNYATNHWFACIYFHVYVYACCVRTIALSQKLNCSVSSIAFQLFFFFALGLVKLLMNTRTRTAQSVAAVKTRTRKTSNKNNNNN